jgi:hypothetical protein
MSSSGNLSVSIARRGKYTRGLAVSTHETKDLYIICVFRPEGGLWRADIGIVLRRIKGDSESDENGSKN